NSSKSNITISQASVTGTGFSFSGPSLPITLAPQQNVNLYVTFAPQSSGSADGTLSVVTGSAIGNSGKQRSNSTTISLSGTGTSSGQLAANPSNLNFGAAQVGTSQSITGTLTNSTTSSVTVSQASVTGAGFAVGCKRDRVQLKRIGCPADSIVRTKHHILRCVCSDTKRHREWVA